MVLVIVFLEIRKFCMCLLQLLEDIEEHLGVTIPQIDTDFIVPVDEFDGKVVYGAKRTNAGVLIFISFIP